MTDNTRNTIKFTVPGDEKDNMHRILRSVFDALNEKGYITNYNNARSMICKIDRDELLQDLVHSYLFENS